MYAFQCILHMSLNNHCPAENTKNKPNALVISGHVVFIQPHGNYTPIDITATHFINLSENDTTREACGKSIILYSCSTEDGCVPTSQHRQSFIIRPVNTWNVKWLLHDRNLANVLNKMNHTGVDVIGVWVKPPRNHWILLMP